MPKIEAAGRYPAIVKTAEFGESESGKPFLNLYFETDDGQPKHIAGWLYLSEAAFPYTVKTLREAFKFDGNFETAIQQIQGKPCSITVDEEANDKGEPRLRVKFINARYQNKPISGDATSFLKGLTAKAARVPREVSKSPAPTRTPAAAGAQVKEPDPF